MGEEQKQRKQGFEVERKVRVQDAKGEDAYELVLSPEGVAISTLKVRFRATKVPVENLRAALAALDS